MIDQKDLSAIAKALGDVLGPQMREAIAEMVSVRVEAATQSLRDELADAKAAATTMTEKSVALAGELEAVRAKQDERFSFLAEEAKAVTGRFLSVDEALTSLSVGDQSGLAQLTAFKEEVQHSITEVRAAIPTLPEPPALPVPFAPVVDGELAPAMQAAFELAAKHIFTPLLESRTGAIANDFKELSAYVAGYVDSGAEAMRGVTDQIRLVKDSIPTVPEAFTPVAEGELVPSMRAAMEIAAKQLFVPMLQAQEEALTERVEATDNNLSLAREVYERTFADLTLRIDATEAIGGEVKEYVGTVESKLRGALDSVANETDTRLKDISNNLNDASATIVKLLALPAVLRSEISDASEASDERSQTRLDAALQNAVPAAAAAEAKAVATELVKKCTAAVEYSVKDLSAHVEQSVAEALKSVPTIVDGQMERVAEAVTPQVKAAVHDSAVKAAQEAATLVSEAHVENVRPQVLTLGREAGVEAANERLQEALPAAIAAVSGAVLEKTVAPVLARAADAGQQAADAHFRDALSALEILATEAGAAAGITAAQKTVPEYVESLRQSMTEEIEARTILAADTTATRITNLRWDEVKEAATTVAVAKSMAECRVLAALDGEALPGKVAELVQAQTDQLIEAVLPGAKAAAEATAKTIGDAMLVAAGEHAGTVAQKAATAAAGALRDQLVADLDPTEQINKTVDAKLVVVAKDLGDAIVDAVETHVKEELPRMEINLTSKMLAAVDRIPPPKDGEDGEDGKDGRMEPAVPYEEGKSYEYGTWAMHAGSVWFAERRTKLAPSPDNRDWTCMVPGILRATTNLQSRSLSVVIETGDGTLHTSHVTLDIPIPKGVYNDKHEYDKRDIATYDGSWWEALKSGPLPTPGTDGSAWKLQIKRGANASAPKQAPAPQHDIYVGEWMQGKLYIRGQQTDHAGYRWMALKSTHERPPFSLLKSNDVWTMLGAST